MFRLWTDDELKDAIRAIEEDLAGGIATTSYAGGGMVQMTQPGEQRITLQSLYDELGTRLGYRHLARNRGRLVYYKMRD
ncbi:hypothetical protein [Pelagibacterium sp.]|uniref:hypothetical protein n=1 Tax=Pelagibacterium sp. TaxID=1967288 RepID=UPI003A8FC355